jgi:maleate isomerase
VSKEQTVNVQQVQASVELDNIAPLGRVGLLALATDFNSEQDLRRIFPEGLEVFTNRVKNANPLTIENLLAMTGDVTRAAEGILPGLGVDAMIYGCTSGTIAIGTEKLNALIHAAWPGIPVTNPVVAAQEAFKAFGAKKISVLTPYNDEINAMTSISPDTIYRAALEVCDEQADLLFISCTALRSSLAIERAEQELGKPVVTSNQALAWHVLQSLGQQQTVSGFGSLFRLKIDE